MGHMCPCADIAVPRPTCFVQVLTLWEIMWADGVMQRLGSWSANSHSRGANGIAVRSWSVEA